MRPSTRGSSTPSRTPSCRSTSRHAHDANSHHVRPRQTPDGLGSLTHHTPEEKPCHRSPPPGPAALVVRFAAGRLTVNTAADDQDSRHDLGRRASGQPGQRCRRRARRGDDRRATWRHDRGDRADVEGLVRPKPEARRPCRRAAASARRRRRQVRRRSTRSVSSVALPSRRLPATSTIEHAAELQVRSASGDVAAAPSSAMPTSTPRRATSGWTRSADRPSSPPPRATSTSTTSPATPAVRSASGDVGRQGSRRVGRACALPPATSASASCAGGVVEIDSASGDVEVGVAAGTAAWLDVQALSGGVSSSLEPTDSPGDDAETVSIHAHTLSGDIRVRRAPN